AGCASTRFHRPTERGSGMGLSPDAQAAIKAARTFTDAFEIFRSQPRPDLIAHAEPNEVYCLADPGAVYALYFARGGRVRLRVSRSGSWQLRWFDPRSGSFANPQSSTADNNLLELTAPQPRPWLVLIEPGQTPGPASR
ncbi:MAG: hypothetical protein ACE5K7_07650, partial [Phycisphaerae bacterium]